MALPSSLKVGALYYEVNLVPKLGDWNHGADGQTWATAQEIRIDADMPETRQEMIFLHEVMHVAASFMEIGGPDKLTEEQWISRMAPILYTILKESGLLVF